MTSFEIAARAAINTRLISSTRQNYTRALERWLAYCAEHRLDPSAPPDGAASHFRDAVVAGKYNKAGGKSLENSSVRNHLAALSFVYGRLAAQRNPLVSWNPFSSRAVEWPPSSQEGLTEAMTAAEAKKILDACADGTPRGLRDLAVLTVLYETGLRRMSLLSLRRDRLFRYEDQVKGRATPRVEARVEVKGSAGASLDRVTLPPASVAAIDAWLAVAPRGQFVFTGRDGRRALDRSTLNKILAARAESARVAHAHPHRFRVAFITAAFDAGLNQRDIQASVHHKDPRSTQRYDRGQRGAEVAAAVAKHRKRP